jgi:hypothetical protein
MMISALAALITFLCLQEAGVPAPEITGKPLSVSKTDFEGATRTEHASGPIMLYPPTSIQVTPDGKSLYIPTQDGVLRKISLPEFKEESRLTMTRSLGSLVLSQEGLVLMTSSKKGDADTQFWVIDPDTLKVRKTIATDNAGWVAATPGSSLVVSSTKSDKPGDWRLLVTDLKTEKSHAFSGMKLAKDALAQLKKAKMPDKPPTGWLALQLTPDARYIFNCPSVQGLSRLRLNGSVVAYEEVGPMLEFAASYAISPDSKLIALTAKKGLSAKDHPDRGDFGIYVYKLENLQKPILTVPNAEFLGFGKEARILARRPDGELAIVDATGKELKRVHMILGRSDPAPQVSQAFVSTAGDRLVLRIGEAVSCIDLAD